MRKRLLSQAEISVIRDVKQAFGRVGPRTRAVGAIAEAVAIATEERSSPLAIARSAQAQMYLASDEAQVAAAQLGVDLDWLVSMLETRFAAARQGVVAQAPVEHTPGPGTWTKRYGKVRQLGARL